MPHKRIGIYGEIGVGLTDGKRNDKIDGEIDFSVMAHTNSGVGIIIYVN